jgi:hypothetical protein
MCLPAGVHVHAATVRLRRPTGQYSGLLKQPVDLLEPAGDLVQEKTSGWCRTPERPIHCPAFCGARPLLSRPRRDVASAHAAHLRAEVGDDDPQFRQGDPRPRLFGFRHPEGKTGETSDKYQMPTMQVGALIGPVGTGQPFPIESQRTPIKRSRSDRGP